jgi:hypothetical protein
MKLISLAGLSIAVLLLFFSFYLMFVVAPDSEVAVAEMERISMEHMDDYTTSLFEVPGYEEAFMTSEKKTSYGMFLFFGSIVPFLLCIVPTFKKNVMASLGLVISIATFIIGAAYGTHMFS